MLHYIFLEYLLHTNPHKNVYISKQNNAINIISSDSESTINFTLENHVFGKTHILSFFLILKGLCPNSLLILSYPEASFSLLLLWIVLILSSSMVY